MYTIFRPPAAFYEYLIKVVIAPHLTTAAQKRLLYYPLNADLNQYTRSPLKFAMIWTMVWTGNQALQNIVGQQVIHDSNT